MCIFRAVQNCAKLANCKQVIKYLSEFIICLPDAGYLEVISISLIYNVQQMISLIMILFVVLESPACLNCVPKKCRKYVDIHNIAVITFVTQIWVLLPCINDPQLLSDHSACLDRCGTSEQADNPRTVSMSIIISHLIIFLILYSDDKIGTLHQSMQIYKICL